MEVCGLRRCLLTARFTVKPDIGGHILSQPVFSVKIEVETGGIGMSSAHHEPWLDRWWPLLVILFGVLFVTMLVSFHPGV